MAHQVVEVRRLHRIQLPFGPIIEHDLYTIANPAEAIREEHVGIQDQDGVDEPDGERDVVDDREGQVYVAGIPRLYHLRHKR